MILNLDYGFVHRKHQFRQRNNRKKSTDLGRLKGDWGGGYGFLKNPEGFDTIGQGTENSDRVCRGESPDMVNKA